ncbi:hypothetical protein [Coleofasciculus sp. H7-2]|uniref:hypothetical protein n=1 Tax=Coleofasciculus sp. H7-2 TaxID=3351545 RepID=UPI00366ED14D
MAFSQNELFNRQVVLDLVRVLNPTYSVKFTAYKYARWDATIFKPSGQIAYYIESKVRSYSSTRFDSAIVGDAKAQLREQSKQAPVYVVSWYQRNNLVYLYPFARNGILHPSHSSVIKSGKNLLLLPFPSSYCYAYCNRTLTLLSRPVSTFQTS